MDETDVIASRRTSGVRVGKGMDVPAAGRSEVRTAGLTEAEAPVEVVCEVASGKRRESVRLRAEGEGSWSVPWGFG